MEHDEQADRMEEDAERMEEHSDQLGERIDVVLRHAAQEVGVGGRDVVGAGLAVDRCVLRERQRSLVANHTCRREERFNSVSALVRAGGLGARHATPAEVGLARGGRLVEAPDRATAEEAVTSLPLVVNGVTTFELTEILAPPVG